MGDIMKTKQVSLLSAGPRSASLLPSVVVVTLVVLLMSLFSATLSMGCREVVESTNNAPGEEGAGDAANAGSEGSGGSGDDGDGEASGSLVGTWVRELDGETISWTFGRDGTVVKVNEGPDFDGVTFDGLWYFEDGVLTISEIVSDVGEDGVPGEDTYWEGISAAVVDNILYLGVLCRESGSGDSLTGTWKTVEIEGGSERTDDESIEEEEVQERVYEVDGDSYQLTEALILYNVLGDEEEQMTESYSVTGRIWQEGSRIFYDCYETDEEEQILGSRVSEDIICLGNRVADEPEDNGYRKVD
jgi:hypothetical protein